MYAFISHCQTNCNSSAGTRARKIVSIRQFWKYLKNKAQVIDDNVAEQLETPKIPKRLPVYLTLEESVRLLIASDGMMKQYDNLMEQAHERQGFAIVAEPGEQYGADAFEKQLIEKTITDEKRMESKIEQKVRYKYRGIT